MPNYHIQLVKVRGHKIYGTWVKDNPEVELKCPKCLPEVENHKVIEINMEYPESSKKLIKSTLESYQEMRANLGINLIKCKILPKECGVITVDGMVPNGTKSVNVQYHYSNGTYGSIVLPFDTFIGITNDPATIEDVHIRT